MESAFAYPFLLSNNHFAGIFLGIKGSPRVGCVGVGPVLVHTWLEYVNSLWIKFFLAGYVVK